ncbi:MAG: hypothetical protein IIY06_04150, partial [Proteobacteria bacterium]|nr:hypothetical protein [Pseudomonadota bacterium]
GYSPKALRALYNALSTNFACIDKNIRTTGLAYFHIVMFILRIQDIIMDMVYRPTIEWGIINHL